MIQGFIGRKLGMTQVFDEKGIVHPVTVVEAGPCVVTQVKTVSSDGYEALQLGFGLSKRLNKPEQGQRRASGFMSRTLREVQAQDVSGYEVGQVLKADVFAAVGTSGQVYPAAAFVHWARAAGAHTVELNLEVTTLSNDFHVARQGPAGTLVPAWVEELLG